MTQDEKKNRAAIKKALEEATIMELADELKKKMKAVENGEDDGLQKCISWGFPAEVNEALVKDWKE